MSTKQVVNAAKAPKVPINVLNHAIISNGMVYCSGQLPIDPATGKLVDGDITAHTHQALKNLVSVLEAAGTTAEHVVKVNVFVADIADVPKLNEAYEQYFGPAKPCRSCVGVRQLPLGTDIEVECIAALPSN